MAERKKSQAEKAAMAKKQTKTSGSKTSAAKKNTKNARKQEDTSLNIPVRLITSLVCVTLFILFLPPTGGCVGKAAAVFCFRLDR